MEGLWAADLISRSPVFLCLIRVQVLSVIVININKLQFFVLFCWIFFGGGVKDLMFFCFAGQGITGISLQIAHRKNICVV